MSQSFLFPKFGNRPHGCWGSAIFYFGNLTEHPASEVAVMIAAKNAKTLENQGLTASGGIQQKLFPAVPRSLRNGSPPKKALKKTIFGLAKNAKTLENQGLSEIKQNPENFFSGSFLLVDHQGLEIDTPLKNTMNRRF